MNGMMMKEVEKQFSQNQQDFLDEYLPQWDDQLAIQKQKLEMEWENPFVAKRGEDHTVLHFSKNEEKDDDLPYPKFRKFKQLAAQIINKQEEHAFPTATDAESSTSYQPPPDAILGPTVYPPARHNPQPTYKPYYQFGYPQGRGNAFNGSSVEPLYGSSIIISCLTCEVMFCGSSAIVSRAEYALGAGVLPVIKFTHTFVYKMCKDAALAKELRDLSLCSAIPIPGYYKNNRKKYRIRKSRTYKRKPYNSHVGKITFAENLLGESKKLMWQQWRTVYPSAYSALETIADDPQNITSQVRQLIIMEDPYRGSTDEQDRTYRDLDRITCEDTNNLWSFLEDFQQLAIKSGKLYFPSTTEKLFAKPLPSLSNKIEESFKAKHPDAALAKELRDLSLCSAIPIPGNYKNNRKKYRIRKSRTSKGKPYNSHVKPFKRKYKDDRGRVKKCKCFICGKKGHFAKDCRSKQGNIARSSAIYQELDLDDNWDIVSADFDDSSVYSISEGEGDVHQNISVMVQDTPFEEADFTPIEGFNESDDERSIEENYDDQNSHHAFMFHTGPPTKIADMVQSAGSWKLDKELPTQSKTCALCARTYLDKIVNVKGKQPHKPEEEKDFSSNEVKLLKELLKEKTEQVQQMIRDQAKEYYENMAIRQREEELRQSEKSCL
nr:hypothetical protein [Tanacetum cinerariifolium]